MKLGARLPVFGSVLIGLAIGVVASLRLAAVVAATPANQLFDEPMMFADPDVTVSANAAARADRIAAMVNDPALFRARIHSCQVARQADLENEVRAAERAHCLDALESALRAAPASGELWLSKATVLGESGEIGPDLFEALRNSFRLSKHEGWIATGRVILGLRLLPLLPDDLAKIVQSDLVLVAEDPNLSKYLAWVYASDLNLRNSGADALNALTANQLYRFVSLVRQAMQQTPVGTN